MEGRLYRPVGRFFDREVVDLQVAVISFAFGGQIPSGEP